MPDENLTTRKYLKKLDSELEDVEALKRVLDCILECKTILSSVNKNELTNIQKIWLLAFSMSEGQIAVMGNEQTQESKDLVSESTEALYLTITEVLKNLGIKK